MTPHRDGDGSAHEEKARWESTRGTDHGHRHRYLGYVTYVGGREGERLRSELASVVHELLAWAVTDSRENPAEPAKDEGGEDMAA